MGILNVTLNTINNTTAGVRDGYKDYSCAVGPVPAVATTLTVGVDYVMRVTTNAGAAENVRAWLDLNNDGQFNTSTEEIFASSGTGLQTRTVRIGAGAAVGVPLRLRVAADYSLTTLPGPCTTSQYSQTEDYAVTLQASTAAPVAAFVGDQPLTCSGCVQFTDQSQNAPTSWLWNFGDNTTSTQQNPRHCYTTPGTYTVTLTATNAAGNNLSTRAGYITYNTQVPAPAAATCAAATVNYCCGYGITGFALGSLSNSSADGSVGYQDFTCTKRVSLIEGNSYTVSVQTGNTNAQDTRVWLDLNNDGTFTSNELLLTALNRTTNVFATLTIPGSALKNTPLRLRVISDFAGSIVSPCGSVQFGQAEDYSVTVLPNTQPPIANFTSNYSSTCASTVQFTDQSQNAPTSWLWNFGDNTTSTQQNPTHAYTTSGVYTVTLTASNAFGQNISTKANYIAVAVPCITYCASTSSGTTANIWIANVTVSGSTLPTPFSNSSAAEANGYGDYTTKVMSLRQGSTYNMSVVSGTTFNRTTTAWIDYNRNGVFDNASEILYNTQSGAALSANFTVPNLASVVGFTRMRIITRLNNNAPFACQVNQANAETEDYSVNITPLLSAQEARSLASLSVYPNPTPDGRVHLQLAEGRATDTYALTVENTLGAVVLRSQVRLVPGTAAAVDLSTLPRGLYLLRLQGTDGQPLVRRVLRD
ncbi:GEVED domain-containing protein [Hymenobacter busanensis]|nr:GEVED domain-containing protein [Hymenobacter busanensis]QHJ05887.1 PKD domain-containing protein [Hymenobacter busanensis]